jgi:hypothetical protein
MCHPTGRQGRKFQRRMHSSPVTLARCGKFRKKLKYTGGGRKKLIYGEKVERKFSGKEAVLIFNNTFVINKGLVAFTAEHKYTA